MADKSATPTNLCLIPLKEKTDAISTCLAILSQLYHAVHRKTILIHSIICELCGMEGSLKRTMTTVRLMISRLESQVNISPRPAPHYAR